DHAHRQGKPLLAVPGSIFSGVSTGTHGLLRTGTPPATAAADVIAAIDAIDAGTSRNEAQAVPKATAAAPRTRSRNTARITRVEAGQAAPVRALDPALAPVLALWGDDEACALDALA